MSNFLKATSKQVSDVRNFLRNAAGGNSIKYSAQKGAKDIIYIPYTTETIIDDATGAETSVKKLCAIEGSVHEWTGQDGKFKATVCAKGSVIKADDGVTILNDGSCPFCNRISDAWDIYRYRKELEESTCKLTGEQRKTHLEKTFSTFSDERKAKDARAYMYILVVKYRLNESGVSVIGADGLPEYDLKVMKLSASRIEKIQQQVANSGSELPGSELIFEYPNTDDRRLLVSQSTTAPVFPNNMLTVKYPALLNKINQDIAKFDWEGLEKSFPEWAGMTSAEAKTTVDNMFEQWDKYQAELKTNPTAKYLEYVVETPTATPSINPEGIGGVGAIPVVPSIPTVPGADASIPVPTIPVVPTAETPVVPTEPVAPVTPAADPNAVFAGAGAAAPTITV